MQEAHTVEAPSASHTGVATAGGLSASQKAVTLTAFATLDQHLCRALSPSKAFADSRSRAPARFGPYLRSIRASEAATRTSKSQGYLLVKDTPDRGTS
eukprot:5878947-Prymnesium_polylepis.1